MCSVPPNCAPRVVKMVHFMLRVFYENKKEQIQAFCLSSWSSCCQRRLSERLWGERELESQLRLESPVGCSSGTLSGKGFEVCGLCAGATLSEWWHLHLEPSHSGGQRGRSDSRQPSTRPQAFQHRVRAIYQNASKLGSSDLCLLFQGNFTSKYKTIKILKAHNEMLLKLNSITKSLTRLSAVKKGLS